MFYNCYIHIPFCRSICKYCRFASFSVLDPVKIQNYVDALCREIKGSGKYQILRNSKIDIVGQQQDRPLAFQQQISTLTPVSPSIEDSQNYSQPFYSLQTVEDNQNSLFIVNSKISKAPKLLTLYFGGGTPTTLSEKQFRQIFSVLREEFEFSDDIEITIESTPEEISLEKLKYLTDLGMTRLSIGVQTFNKQALIEVKRDKKGNIKQKLEIINKFLTSQKQSGYYNLIEQDSPLSSFYEAGSSKFFKKKGLSSVSLDFIIGLPFVKKGEVLENISYIIKNFPFIDHFSVYMLEDYYRPGEEGEKFEQIVYPENWENNSISEEEIGEEYLKIKEYLEQNGFVRYELSNFAKKQNLLAYPLIKSRKVDDRISLCKHNYGYWSHKDILSFGLGASGLLGNIRYKNSEDFLEYYGGKKREVEVLSSDDIFLEKVMFNLRTSGIGQELVNKLNRERLDYFLENGYLEERTEKIILTDRGSLYLDYILNELI